MRTEVARLLYRHDPIGIGITLEGPLDEYDLETRHLLPLLPETHSPDDLGCKVYRVFVHCFDEASAGIRDRYSPVAADLWDLWLRHQGVLSGPPGQPLPFHRFLTTPVGRVNYCGRCLGCRIGSDRGRLFCGTCSSWLGSRAEWPDHAPSVPPWSHCGPKRRLMRSLLRDFLSYGLRLVGDRQTVGLLAERIAWGDSEDQLAYWARLYGISCDFALFRSYHLRSLERIPRGWRGRRALWFTRRPGRAR